MSGDTIYALSSGPAPSGVAVIRFSGPGTVPLFQAFCGRVPDPRVATLCCLKNPDDECPLDQALVLFFEGPASFTGEDVGEFHIHGGRAVVTSVLEALGRFSFTRMAERGEFSRRAFENGKLDLVEIEGLSDLIAAETDLQRRQALAQLGGVSSKLYEGWRAELIRASAFLEAALDFSDEGDVADDIALKAVGPVKDLLTNLERVLADQNRGEIVRGGFRVVLAGLPNAGKSCLMNLLAKRDVAIVSEEAGTTRDVIEVTLDLGGMAVVMLDTAGVRETDSKVEQEGIRRSFEAVAQADLVVWVIDGDAPDFNLPPTLKDRVGPVLIAWNKADIAQPSEAERGQIDLAFSAQTGAGIEGLIKVVREAAHSNCPPVEGAAITRVRHRELLTNAAASLQDFLDGDLEDSELRAEDLRRAAFALGRLTGKVDVEDILDHLFFEFCIGK